VFLLDSPDSDEPTLEELRALPKLFAPKAAAEEMAAVAEELGMVRGRGSGGRARVGRSCSIEKQREGAEQQDLGQGCCLAAVWGREVCVWGGGGGGEDGLEKG
jgi:hypothetical protein